MFDLMFIMIFAPDVIVARVPSYRSVSGCVTAMGVKSARRRVIGIRRFAKNGSSDCSQGGYTVNAAAFQRVNAIHNGQC